MTAYFDQLNSTVRELSQERDIDVFLRSLINLEQQVVQVVSLATGDREFPHEHREQIQGIIACKGIKPRESSTINGRAREMAKMMLYSEMIRNLHEAFHQVARKRITTRFGLLTDDPSQIVKARDDHDERD